MLVKQLIKELKKFDENLEVVKCVDLIYDSDGDLENYSDDRINVSERAFETKKRVYIMFSDEKIDGG